MTTLLPQEAIPVTVDELQKLRFSQLSLSEKVAIKTRGRPLPDIQTSQPGISNNKLVVQKMEMKDRTSAMQDFNRAVFNESYEESQKVYDEISKDLDNNLKVLGTVLHHHVALQFKNHTKDVNPSLVLDVGGGTGYASEHLRRDAEYKGEIDIMDANMELLYLASKKSVGFRNIIRHSIAGPLPVRDHSYDVLICIGVFLPHHIPPSSVPEIVRAAKPGGLFIFSVRAQTTEDYNAELFANIQKCIDEGKLELVERKEYPHSPNCDSDIGVLLIVYRCK